MTQQNIWQPNDDESKKLTHIPFDIQKIAHEVSLKFGWSFFTAAISNMVLVAYKLLKTDPKLFQKLLDNSNS